MRLASLALPFAICALLLGCAANAVRPIPEGTYGAPQIGQYVVAHGTQLRFQEGLQPERVLGEYEYSVYKDHHVLVSEYEDRIQPYYRSSDDAVFGEVGRYYWFWDGQNIVRGPTRDGTGEAVVFAPLVPPRP